MALVGSWHQTRVKPPQQCMWGHDQSLPGVSLEATVGSWGFIFPLSVIFAFLSQKESRQFPGNFTLHFSCTNHIDMVPRCQILQ